MSSNTALVTGASAGIGREIACIHAARGGDVVLVARREAALEDLAGELEAEHGIAAHPLAADLATPDGPGELYRRVKERGVEVEVLVNNAGFGGQGPFHRRELQWNLSMVDLNVKALMTLTHLVLQEMVPRGRGRILNVGSTAGMVPGPLQATYHATKAFVNSFSQALANELEEHGITVTVLAPGPVDTEFFAVADLEDAKGPQQGRASPAEVARVGYEAMERGDLLVIDDPKLRLLLGWVAPLLPRRTVLSMSRQFAEKEGA